MKATINHIPRTLFMIVWTEKVNDELQINLNHIEYNYGKAIKFQKTLTVKSQLRKYRIDGSIEST